MSYITGSSELCLMTITGLMGVPLNS
jgi:hypothetical protein